MMEDFNMREPEKIRPRMGRVILAVIFICGLAYIGFRYHSQAAWAFQEWRIGCLSIFPYTIEADKSDVRYPWKVCKKDEPESCIQVSYKEENGRIQMKDGCFTFGKEGRYVSWCGTEIEAEQLPPEGSNVNGRDYEAGWFDYHCVDTTEIDRQIEEAWNEIHADCLHLMWETGKQCDCKESPLQCIEILSDKSLHDYYNSSSNSSI